MPNMNEPEVHDHPNVDREYFSLGYLCQHFQWPLNEIRAVIATAGLTPALRLNGVAYFDGAAFITIGRAILEIKTDA